MLLTDPSAYQSQSIQPESLGYCISIKHLENEFRRLNIEYFFITYRVLRLNIEYFFITYRVLNTCIEYFFITFRVRLTLDLHSWMKSLKP